ncbi:MAG: hypothetical protein RMK30_08920 [Anaerolineae bacterium]|nr:hypothetical protein [Anaerolineae bacterium]MDW8102984.1 hypothetical protein [Anaerolineae bacterium]
MNEAGLAFLIFFLLFLYIAFIEVRLRGKPDLRPIPALDFLRGVFQKAIESGKPLHISSGTGTIGEKDTAETRAGLSLLEYAQRQGSRYGVPVISTFFHPAPMLSAYDFKRKTGAKDGRIYFIAPERATYAAGAAEVLKNERPILHLAVGPFGYEFLLLSEMANSQGIDQVAGSVDPAVLPFVYSSTEHYLLGEEVFAAGAYLSGEPHALAGIIAQDVMRFILIVGIALGVILKTLGVI